MIALRFTCRKRKIWENIKKSQNMMKMIVGIQRTKNIVIFAILGSLVNIRR